VARYLKWLAAVVAVSCLFAAAGFTKQVIDDEAYARAVLVKQRNPGNVLFDSEYRVAEATRVFRIYSALACFLTAAIGGSLLWGLGALHAKFDRAVEEARQTG
jgi:hypothetical protein